MFHFDKLVVGKNLSLQYHAFVINRDIDAIRHIDSLTGIHIML